MPQLAKRRMQKLRIVHVAVSGLVWFGSSVNSVVMGELPIGLSDFPRKIRRQLPELKAGRAIELGALKLHPSFESSIEYDDNILLSKSDGKDDVIFTQVPGLIGELRLGDHRLEAGYGMELLQFAKEQEENTTNHLAHGLAELNFDNLRFELSDTFDDSTGRIFTETSARDHVLLNTVALIGRFDRPRWAMEGGWTHNTVDHRTSQFNLNDYGEDVFSALAGYQVLPKTLWLLEVDVGHVNYDRNLANADQVYWQLFTGLRGELTPKLTSTLKIGFQDRQLSEVGGQGALSNFDGVVADMQLEFVPTKTDTLQLNYLRSVFPSTHGGNSWYRLDKISGSYRKRFLKKWLCTPSCSWQLNDYPEPSTAGGVTKKRADHFVQAGASLRYAIQEWMSAGVAYNFRTRNSNLNAFDYENNRVRVDLTLAF